MRAMNIPQVGDLIIRCWCAAEDALREQIRIKYPDGDEEFVTWLFRGELAAIFDQASDGGLVEKAFLSDLKLAFPTVRAGSLVRIAHGIIATVTFHPRQIERVTGGDLGIVMVRPDVQRVQLQESLLTIDHDYMNGLLVQAKMFRRNSQWGNLTAKQKRDLPGKLDYFALLLYRFVDSSGERRGLEPFKWQLPNNNTIETIRDWLASDNFPDPQDSRQILGKLIQNTIGTSDKEIILRDIAPPMRPTLEIKIRWPDGDDPGNKVRVELEQDSTVHQQQYIRALN